MDFLKFFSLVRTRKLYFPSAWQLLEQDPFEGSLNVFHSKFMGMGVAGGGEDKTWFQDRNVVPEGFEEDKWKLIVELQKEQRKQMRKYMYINSWHMDEHESVAMWKLYDLSGNGLAVVTTFERLCASLARDKPFYAGRVTYIDHQTDDKWFGCASAPFMHKSRSLRHEEEVRAIIWDHLDPLDLYDNLSKLRPTKRDRTVPDPPIGISIECDLEKLIDHVVISPTAPTWVVELVTDFCRETLGKDASTSALRLEPFF